MARQCNANLSRAISVADYILEDNGHSIVETSREFNCSKTTIKRDINYLGAVAFYGHEPNEKDLQLKYIKVKETLAKFSKNQMSK